MVALMHWLAPRLTPKKALHLDEFIDLRDASEPITVSPSSTLRGSYRDTFSPDRVYHLDYGSRTKSGRALVLRTSIAVHEENMFSPRYEERALHKQIASSQIAQDCTYINQRRPGADITVKPFLEMPWGDNQTHYPLAPRIVRRA